MSSHPSALLRARLGDDLPRATRRCGIEHEYSIYSDATPIPFARVLEDVRVDGRCLDPGDPNARRLPWGGVLTVDGLEAEIATPPVALQQGAARDVVALAARGHSTLTSLITAYDESLAIVGYSTHVNVSAPDRLTRKIGRVLVRHFSVPLMLLLDQRDSPGILVRPRRHRIELAGEYLQGPQLRAALNFFAGAVSYSRRSLSQPWLLRRLPPLSPPALVRADQRFGWYVDRKAFGVDLYAEGRAARLHRRTTAGEALRASWSVIRDDTAAIADQHDVQLLDEIVTGIQPLPLEASCTGASTYERSSAHGSVTRDRCRSGFVVVARVATWNATLFEITAMPGRETRRVVNVPDRYLERFIDLLDAGELDDILRRALRSPPTGPLASEADTERLDIYDSVADNAVFTPTERDVVTGRISGGGAGRGREQKHGHSNAPRARPQLKWLAAAGVAVVAVAAIAVAAVAMAGGGSKKAAAPPPTPATAALTASAVTGVYAESIGSLTTTYTRGLLQGQRAVRAGDAVTYTSPDTLVPTKDAAPSGTATLRCEADTCVVTNGNIGLPQFTVTTTGAIGPASAPISVFAACGVPAPPASAGSGQPVAITVQRDAAGRVASLRLHIAYVYFRETRGGANDQCANVLVASLEEVMTRTG